MKTSPFIMFLMVFMLLGITINGYSQQSLPFSMKSTQFSIIGEEKVYNDVNYFEFNNRSITLYNKNSKVKTEFIIYKSQQTYDAETESDLTILDCWDTRNKDNVRIILVELKEELILMLNDIVFYNLEFIDY